MNKADLVAKIAEKTGFSKAEAERSIDAFTSSVKEALSNADDVVLVGFGTFTVSNRQARRGRNPRTGEVITIPASRMPKFKAGKGLKDAVKG